MKKFLLLGSLLLTSAGGFTMVSNEPAAIANPNPAVSGRPAAVIAEAADAAQADNPVKVLDYGATTERQELRFSPTVGTTQKATVKTAIEMAMSIDGQAIPAFSVPSIAMDMDLTVDKIEDGLIHTTFKYTDIRVEATESTPEALAETLREQLETLKGAEGKLVFDNRGTLKDFDFELPDKTGDATQRQIIDQLSSSIQQLSNALPEEAVGIGAKWQVPQAITISGLKLNQLVTYTLTGYQDNVMQLDLTIEQGGETGASGLAGLPEGTEAHLKALKTQGNGTLSHDLSQVMPSTTAMEMATNMVVEISSKGSQTTTIEADLNMNINQTSPQ